MIHSLTLIISWFSEVKFYVHLRPVSLLSAARPGRDLIFFGIYIYIFFAFFFPKQIQRSNCLKYRREHVFSECDSFVRHFENEMPLTIFHGREMSTILNSTITLRVADGLK